MSRTWKARPARAPRNAKTAPKRGVPSATAPIAGATGATYTPIAADKGFYLQCEVTASTWYGTGTDFDGTFAKTT